MNRFLAGSALGAAGSVALALAWPSTALACLHAHGGGEAINTPVSQKGQQALILHNDGVEDLFLKIEYQAGETSALAWIVPVPAVPTEYGAADPALFQKLAEWAALERRRPALRSKGRKSAGAPRAAAAALTLLPPAAVGPFAIQPIQARGPSAGEALNRWMTDNGFQKLPAATMSYYIEREWTFLAIKVSAAEGAKSLSPEGGLPPLRITFPSQQAVYPLKLSTHMGIFTARVYLITAKSFAADAFNGARARGFEVVSDGYYFAAPTDHKGRLHSAVKRFAPDDAPAAVRKLLQKRFAGASQLSFTVLLNERVNGDQRYPAGRYGPDEVVLAAARWNEDLAVPALPEHIFASTPDKPGEAPAPAAPKDSKNSSGCAGCVASGHPSGGFWLLLAALALALRDRRQLNRVF